MHKLKTLLVVVIAICGGGYLLPSEALLTWTQCAAEGATCSFSGPARIVRYGTTKDYRTKPVVGSVACTSAQFGNFDPAPQQTKFCWYAGAAVLTGGIPNPLTIKTPVKPTVGLINATTGQVIENVHVTTATGPCIVINGVSNVTIRNSEIGPCGVFGDNQAVGVLIQGGAHTLTIERNVFHDFAGGIYANSALHPIKVDRNYFYNIRGPLARGQAVQFNGVNGGTGFSQVTCNVSDVLPGTRYGVDHNVRNVEDHYNFHNTKGVNSTTGRTVVAYNRARGGHPTSTSGSGIMNGDGPTGGNMYAHSNVIVNVRNVGIGVAGGTDITVENNKIFMDAAVFPINVGMYASNYGTGSCANIAFNTNRVFLTNHSNLYINTANCAPVTQSGNIFDDTSLAASMFDVEPTQCN